VRGIHPLIRRTRTYSSGAVDRPLRRRGRWVGASLLLTAWERSLVGISVGLCMGMGVLHAGEAADPSLANDSTARSAPARNDDRGHHLPSSKDIYLERHSKQGKVRTIREENIRLFEEEIRSGTVEGDELADLIMQLASLYWDNAKDLYLEEMDEYLAAYGAWADTPAEKRGPEPKEDHRASRAFNQKAIDLYRLLMKEHPDYERMDEVIFNLAFNLMDLGLRKQALEYYELFVRTYKNSKLLPDAYLAIGEYYFDNNNPIKALEQYKKAAAFPDSKVRAFALYKLAWCYYNVGEYDAAIDALKRVVESGGQGDDQKKGRVSLKDEALNDLALFFAESKDVDAAYAYFKSHGEPKHFRTMLKRLANIYVELGQNENAVKAWTRLIEEDPLAPDAPVFQDRIVRVWFKDHQKEKTRAEIDRMASTYGPGSEWARHNAARSDVIEKALALIEKDLREIAVDYHTEARKTGSRRTYQFARELYQRYLKLFPNTRHSYDMQFYYAEALYELKDYEAAADAYEKVLKLNPEGAHFEDAAGSLILTIDKILGLDSADKESSAPAVRVDAEAGGGSARTVNPSPLGPWEARKAAACDLFAERLPTHADAPNILYEGARLYYDHDLFDEAIPRLLKIVERYPSTDVAEVSARLVLEAYNRRGDYAALEKQARAFADVQAFNEDFKADLRDMVEKAAYKKIESLQTKGHEIEAANAYRAFFTEFPHSSLADRALFNAAVYFFKAGAVNQAIESRVLLEDHFPQSPLRGRNLDALGKMHESFADYPRAADYYEALAAWDKKHTYEGTPDALFNAGTFRATLGDWEKAVRDFDRYVQYFPNRADAHLVALEACRVLEVNGQRDRALKAYKRYYQNKEWLARSPDAHFEARLHYGLILRDMGRLSEAQRHFQDSVRAFDRMGLKPDSPGGAALSVAHMKFLLVEPLFARFKAVKLDVDAKPRRGGTPFDEKRMLLDEVVKAYSEVLELRQAEWGIAALVRIGEAYRNVALTLLEAPAPRVLKTPEQRALFRAALEDQAFPLNDKAAESLELALTRAYELGLYNEYTAKAWSLLAELRPKEYSKQEEIIGEPTFLSDILEPPRFISLPP